MTSLYFDPATFEAPSEPEPREQLIVNGRYMLPPIGDDTGKRRSLQRVTNFIKMLSDQGGLTTWKLRMAVIGLARDERLYDLATSLTPEDKRDLDELIEKAIDLGQAGPSGGNITGTALHNYTDNVAGQYPIRVRDKWVPKVENYFAALYSKGLRPVDGLSERLVVSERYGTAGRLDDVYEDPFGTLRVGDRKSQKEFQTWWEVGAQLALYQGSDAMWNEAECRWEDMPQLADDLAHVAWMPLNHPAGKKAGGSVDEVTIYDIPLAGPREVLDWCMKVRTLRTQARQWGQERPNLDEFARIARNIRDAETHDELRQMIGVIPALTIEGDPLNRMAAKRWEAIEAAEKAHPAYVPEMSPNEQARQVPTIDDAGTEWAAQYVSEADRSDQGYRDEAFAQLHHTQVDSVAPVIRAGIDYGMPNDAPVIMSFDPSLFVAPEQDATFPADWGLIEQAAGGGRCEECEFARDVAEEPGMLCARHGSRPVDAIPGPERSPEALGGLTPEQYAEATAPLPQTHPVAMAQFTHSKHEGATVVELPDLRTPAEWAQEFGVMIAHADGWAGGPGRFVAKSFDEPLERGEFQARLSSSTVADSVSGAHARKPRTWAEHLDLDPLTAAGMPDAFMSEAEFSARRGDLAGRTITVVSSEGEDSSPGWDPVALQPTLDSVPLKTVREVCTRANNSTSSRGRVRLLNDLDKKYTAHKDVLLPGLLAEWLAVDGGPTKSGFVKSTEGSARQPMLATLASSTTLTDYLATKEVPKSVTVTEEIEAAPAQVRGDDAAEPDDVRLKDSVDISKAVTLPITRERVQQFADQVAERKPDEEAPVHEFGATQTVRQKYINVTNGEHSILRLIEMAKQAENGAERARVFHEITRRKAWKGEIAAEINQHYLDNGYATENFDPYFEAQEIEQAAPVPLDPDDPSSAADALHLLEGVENREALAKFWDGLKAQPWFSDQALQEALLSKMMTLKS